MITLRTIDAHVAGAPLRLVVDGFPAPQGRSMLDKRDGAEHDASLLRRTLMLEPRGHRDMCGALLTEPVHPGSHAGLLFMDSARFGLLSAQGVIAATAVALERGLLMPGGDGVTVVLDTPAGTVTARVAAGSALRTVSLRSVPSFVLRAGLPLNLVSLGNRQIRADVAFGGEFYAIVDSEAAGLPIDSAHLPELRRVGLEIISAIASTHRIEHPVESRLAGIDGAIFTGPSVSGAADLRVVTVSADSAVDRSPCGTGMCAIMAVLSAMGILVEGAPFVCEGIIGTSLTGRIVARTAVGDHEAILPTIEGSAWITGEHTFIVADDDPLREGVLV